MDGNVKYLYRFLFLHEKRGTNYSKAKSIYVIRIDNLYFLQK